VLPTTEVFKTLIMPMTSMAMIPVLLIYSNNNNQTNDKPCKAIQDTKAIMEYLEHKYLTPLSPLVPRSPRKKFVSMLLELLADEWLLIQAMYWRWAPDVFPKQKEFIEYEFGHAATGGTKSYKETIAIGQQRTTAFAAFCPGLGISPATSPSLEIQFRHLLKLLSAHLEYNQFLLGSKVSVADFAFYGSFHAHLSRDPVPGFIIKTTAPLVAAWIERVGLVRQSENSHRPKIEVDDDIIPTTLLPVLQHLMADYVPLLSKSVRETLIFLDKNPTRELPRRIGVTMFDLHLERRKIASGERNLNTHCVWMLQRILDQAYVQSARDACNEVLRSACGTDSKTVGQWQMLVQHWEASGWTVTRNQRNQLVGQHKGVHTRL
jgi:glutathione S-transferase